MRAVRLLSYLYTRIAVLFLSGAVLGCSSILPEDWPIKELTLPRGCKLAAKPKMMAGIDSMTEVVPVGQTWEVCFNYAKGWDALVAHIDARMAAAGYSSSDVLGDVSQMMGGGDSAEPWSQMMPDMSKFSRLYSKPDSDYMVTLTNFSVFKGMDGKPEDDVASFGLKVVKFSTSLPPPIRMV